MDFIALAIAPGIAISLFILYRDSYNREPRLNMIMSFVWGMLTVIPAFFIEGYFIFFTTDTMLGFALQAFLVVALTEELCKFAALRVYAYRQRSFDEPLDGIVYSVMVAMGFATVENLMYVLSYARVGQGYQVAFVRMFLSVPAHATFGVLMGYFVGRARFNPARRNLLFAKGLAWAVFFHGTYDVLLFWQQSPEIEDYISDIALFTGAVVSFIVALRLSWKLILRHRLLSQQTFQPLALMNVRRAAERDIALIMELSRKIWPQTYAQIISREQVSYMMEMMYSQPALSRQMKEGHEFVILSEGGEAIGFASVGLVDPQTYKLHKIYILPGSQGKGAGRFLIDQVVAAVKRKGGQTLRLNVNRNNPAKSFYEKLGFSVVGEEDIDIGGGYFMNDFVMEKKV